MTHTLDPKQNTRSEKNTIFILGLQDFTLGDFSTISLVSFLLYFSVLQSMCASVYNPVKIVPQYVISTSSTLESKIKFWSKIKIQIRFQLISIPIIVITNNFLCSTKILFFHKKFKTKNYLKNTQKNSWRSKKNLLTGILNKFVS